MTAEVTRDPLRQLDGLPEFVAALAADDEPGLAVGVYTDGELTAAATAGCAVPEHSVPITEHTAFDIASVSKHMTSTCLLLLAADGRLDLDADIRASLPELQLSRPVTLRQCLTHTAGLRDYFALCDIAGIAVLGITEDRFMDLAVGQAEFDFEPGSAFSYSNTGYALAAVLVRRLTGVGLARFASERVFGPLGMTATHFRDDVSLLVPRLAAGYVAEPLRADDPRDPPGVPLRGDDPPDPPGVPTRGGDQRQRFRRYDVTEEVVGDGAVVTSLTDLAAWHAFMASGAGLGAETRDALLARQVLTDGTRLGYALGLDAIDIGGNAAWWHSGSWAGYRAAVIYLPEFRAGVSVLANRNDRYAPYVARAVAAALTGGGNLATAYRALTGEPGLAEQARREATSIAGLWYEPDQDVFAEFELARSDADPIQLVRLEQDGRLGFQLGTDGSWHGVGPGAGSTYTATDGALIANWGLSARQEARYLRVEPDSSPDSPRPPAVGIFFNEELLAHAAVSAGESGAAEIVIGLAAPRTLIAAGDGLWRGVPSRSPGGGPVTVRVAEDGAALLISAPGARRVRFDRVRGAVPEPIRGVRGAR